MALIASPPPPQLLPQFDLTFRNLPQVIWAIVQQTWRDLDVIFTQDFPREPVKQPTIAWKVAHRAPGRFGLEHRTDRLRAEKVLADGSLHQTYAQWQTIWYQFNLYDLSNPEVDILTDRFENLLRASVGPLQELGVSEFFFDEEFEDSLYASRQDIFVRSLRWIGIVERRLDVVQPTISEIYLRQLAGGVDKIDVPVVRTAASGDILPDPWVDTLYHVMISPGAPLSASGDYLSGVDYVAIGSPGSGAATISWLPHGAQPAVGATYYASYRVFESALRAQLVPPSCTPLRFTP